MSGRVGSPWDVAVRTLLLCLALLAAACHRSAPAAAAAEPQGQARPAGEAPAGSTPPTVKLTREQIGAIGLATQAVPAAQHQDESAGYGVVLAHDAIAQPLAELRAAEAAARQSASALARARSLSGTPGALSADLEESATRQAGVDTANLALARQKLASVIGASPPWPAAQNLAVLEKIAMSRVRLVRATFPLGALSGALPQALRATALGVRAPAPGWKLAPVWPAPADASVPGRSVFALLEQGEVAEGERLVVYAPGGELRRGAEVPAAALVMSEGRYWVYLERAPGTYARIEIELTAPTPGGYFVTRGVRAGEQVVTSGAAALLAQESDAGGAPD